MLKGVFFFYLKRFNFDIYFIDNLNKIKIHINSKKVNRLHIDNIFFKNYKNDQYYLYLQRFFRLTDVASMLRYINEQRNLYFLLKNKLASYKNLKDVKKLTWLDYLLGADEGYRETYKLYLNFLKNQKLKKKKKNKKLKKKKIFNLICYC